MSKPTMVRDRAIIAAAQRVDEAEERRWSRSDDQRRKEIRAIFEGAFARFLDRLEARLTACGQGKRQAALMRALADNAFRSSSDPGHCLAWIAICGADVVHKEDAEKARAAAALKRKRSKPKKVRGSRRRAR